MADYNIAHKITADFEGGYANALHDLGGETMFGITRKNFPNWPGWAVVDSFKQQPQWIAAVNAHEGLKAMAKAFYKEEFWDCFGLDAVVSQGIANEVFDSAVNLGIGRVSLWLQRAINVTNKNGQFGPDVRVDGKIRPGGETITALNAHKRPGMVLKALNALQGAAYIGFAEANPTQEKFMESWLSRVSF